MSPNKLITPRANSASVVMPDGRVWVLGGAGSSIILQSTEFIEASEGQIVNVASGPDMPEPLMGHCAAVVSDSQVIVMGGFSSLINDYTAKGWIYDFSKQAWLTADGMSPGSRMDSSCRSINSGGGWNVIYAGGWNNIPLTDTGYFDVADSRWKVFKDTSSSPINLPYPLRSSVMVNHDGTSYLIGGVQCDAAGRPCTQIKTILSLPSVNGVSSWNVMNTISLQTQRSSHTVLTIPRGLIPRCN